MNYHAAAKIPGAPRNAPTCRAKHDLRSVSGASAVRLRAPTYWPKLQGVKTDFTKRDACSTFQPASTDPSNLLLLLLLPPGALLQDVGSILRCTTIAAHGR